jgi:prephenate dehydratase
VRVAYLGPPGTVSDEALTGVAPDAEGVPLATLRDVVLAVQERRIERALVPIENALEGGVAATLDALAGEADRVRIAGEVVHPIHHCLVAAAAVPLAEVTRVVSHPQASAQCARFLREHLPRADRVTAPSTADAVMGVRNGDGTTAALGSRLAAELYDCHVLAENVEDRSDNMTRFVWLAPAGETSEPGPDAKTSIVFWGAGDESPGWLVEVLRQFADRGVNLTRIESRPRRVRLGHYMFFADLDGAAERPPVREALEALAGRVEEIRVLGSYPAATGGSAQAPG